ncbi:hypothetical protein E2C01_063079 [Portunus trituberculatus]|uniref:Uncharacterized protein n=1 Tax=Portunus trituberculatus TaxID=210409 RepID=A0A5B7HGJ4_PORTR|nr:hypothetical protein [Portunus trituberculatus]
MSKRHCAVSIHRKRSEGEGRRLGYECEKLRKTSPVEKSDRRTRCHFVTGTHP